MEDTLESRPPSRLFFHEIELMAGFQEDFKSLIEKVVELFKQKRSLRFEHFVAVWKEMSFSLVILVGLFRLGADQELLDHPERAFGELPKLAIQSAATENLKKTVKKHTY